MEGTVTISKSDFLWLRCNTEELGRLENGGVDNWEGYSKSLNPKGEPSMSEWAEREKERINNL